MSFHYQDKIESNKKWENWENRPHAIYVTKTIFSSLRVN